MVQRTRLDPNSSSSYLRFLKPGALAQLRNSRISARSTQLSLPVVAVPSLSPSPAPDASPRLSPPRIQCSGPRCPQRKKLFASKAVLFLSPSATTAAAPDSPGTVIGSLSNDNSFVVAH